jgi:hypothetical protein
MITPYDLMKGSCYSCKYTGRVRFPVPKGTLASTFAGKRPRLTPLSGRAAYLIKLVFTPNQTL